MFSTLNQRSLDVFHQIVETFVETGAPVGSKALAVRRGMDLSSATIRSVMAHLEECGFLYSPHTSAGRLPTAYGLRFYVEGLLKVGALTPEEELDIQEQCRTAGRSLEDVLGDATEALSGLTSCAGLVLAPKVERFLKYIEFVPLMPGRALVVLVSAEGFVENRFIEIPVGTPTSALVEATNYMNTHLAGRNLSEAREEMQAALRRHTTQLEYTAAQVVEEGLGVWGGEGSLSDGGRNLLVYGQSRLLNHVNSETDIERVRLLFEALESKKTFLDILDAVIAADGVQIFIGASDPLFDIAGCSMIVSPYANQQGEVIGAIGVIGPTRMNYGRVIPIVDYTAKAISKLIGER